MNFFARRRTLCLVLALVVGLISLAGGYHLFTSDGEQAGYYNLGLQAYQNGDMQHAVQYFDRSIAVYRQGKNARWLRRFFYAQPSDELAAQANFQKAKALLQAQQAEAAVQAFEESLRLNPGNRNEGLSPEEAARRHEEAMVVKYDLEMLFKSRPDLAQQQGKGQGKGKGKGQPQQDPGQDPSNQAGKGNRDDI